MLKVALGILAEPPRGIILGGGGGSVRRGGGGRADAFRQQCFEVARWNDHFSGGLWYNRTRLTATAEQVCSQVCLLYERGTDYPDAFRRLSALLLRDGPASQRDLGSGLAVLYKLVHGRPPGATPEDCLLLADEMVRVAGLTGVPMPWEEIRKALIRANALAILPSGGGWAGNPAFVDQDLLGRCRARLASVMLAIGAREVSIGAPQGLPESERQADRTDRAVAMLWQAATAGRSPEAWDLLREMATGDGMGVDEARAILGPLVCEKVGDAEAAWQLGLLEAGTTDLEEAVRLMRLALVYRRADPRRHVDRRRTCIPGTDEHAKSRIAHFAWQVTP